MKQKRKKTRRWLTWIIFAAVLAAGSGMYLFTRNGNGSAADAELKMVTYTVEAVTYSSTIDVTGNLEPVDTEEIGFATSGKVARVYVEEGDMVKAGDLIAELDSTEDCYKLASLDYQIESARISGSKSQLALLELEREMQLADLEEKKVWTTISGVVSEMDTREGEYVKTGDQITAIARVIDLSAMHAEVEIDELDVPRVSIGQRVRFSVDALPELKIAGRVSTLPLEGRVTQQGIAVLDAEVIIDDPPKELLPGYSFSAEIIVSEKETILVLDENAVIDRSGKQIVLTPPTTEGGRPMPREVRTSKFENGKVKVISGLEEGETVVALTGATVSGSAQGEQDSSNPLSVLGFSGGPGMRAGGRGFGGAGGRP